jgi:hypothetical protein
MSFLLEASTAVHTKFYLFNSVYGSSLHTGAIIQLQHILLLEHQTLVPNF